MAWGDALGAAWNAASASAKAAAQSAASAARGAYDEASAAVDRAASFAESKAAAAYDYAKEKTRDAEKAFADTGYDVVAAGAEGVRQAYGATTAAVRKSYDKVRSMLGKAPAGSVQQPCPKEKTADKSASNKSMDGWLMAPQGPGKPCLAIPPGKGALAKARSRSKVPSSQGCRRAPGEDGSRDITYVNGISTDAQTHCDTLNAIAAQTCRRVVGVYNATEGLSDATQTGQDRRLIKAAASGKSVPGKDGRNPAVDTLSRLVADETEAGRPPEIWAHSQGGAITSLALYEANNDLGALSGSRNALSGVKVKSFGSAAPKWVDGPSYEHFVHVNDPVPTMFGLGHDGAADAANAGQGAKVIRFGGDVNGAGPFDDLKPGKEWLPHNIDNHSVERSYLKMEKQKNGGCS